MNEFPLYHYRFKPLRVIDGDTLWGEIDLGFNTFIREYIRLYDVDTPEIRGVNATPEGRRATQYAEMWLAGIEETYSATQANFYGPAPFLPCMINSRRYDPREKYGRSLAEVYRDGDPESLNQALVRMGLVKG